ITQPFDQASRNENRTFERIAANVSELPGDGGEEAMLARTLRVAGIGEDEGTGTVSRLRIAGRKAGLADRRRLLIAGQSGNRNWPAEMLRQRFAEMPGAIHDFRQRPFWHVPKRE